MNSQLQQPKEKWVEEFDKAFPKGLYVDANESSGLFEPKSVTEEVENFINKLLTQARQEGYDAGYFAGLHGEITDGSGITKTATDLPKERNFIMVEDDRLGKRCVCVVVF